VNITADIEQGRCCAECTTYFLAAHGRRVVCTLCAAKMTLLAIAKLGCEVATLAEKP
jgi:hypothetical protein